MTNQENDFGISFVYAVCIFPAQRLCSLSAQRERDMSYVRGPDRSNDPFLTLRQEQREGTVVSFLPDKAWN